MCKEMAYFRRYAPLTYYEDVLEASRNEQNKSIAVGPFYIGIYFEPIWTLLPEDVAVLNPTGYRTL